MPPKGSQTNAELFRRLEALERGVSVTISWQEDSLDRLRKWRETLNRMIDAIRDPEGNEVRPLGERRPAAAERGKLLKCLLSALERNTWCNAAFLSKVVFDATGKRVTRRALIQGIYRLRRALRLDGKIWCIEYNRRLGWRMVKVGRKPTDT